MKKTGFRYLTAAFCAFLFAGQLWALSDAECETLLKKAEDLIPMPLLGHVNIIDNNDTA